MTSTNKLELTIAKELAKIHRIDVDSINVYHAPRSERTSPTTTTTKYRLLNIEFVWAGHKVTAYETTIHKLIVEFDGKKITEIFWTAIYGGLDDIRECKLTNDEDYICECIWRTIYKISAKSNFNKKIALKKIVTIGETRIWAEGTQVKMSKNGKTKAIMGHTLDGRMRTSCDAPSEITALIERAFRK
jgi:hypothetical protein